MRDEFSFIKSIIPKRTFQRSLIQGIGDDAALYETDQHYDEMVCTDTLVEGVHFLSETMRPFHIGYKALAVNISDIAAMGGFPLFYLVSIAIPKAWQEEVIHEIYDGLQTIASQYKIDLIGGDTVTTNDRLVITVTVIGRVEKGRKLLRSNARPNDIIFITNTVGNSAAGLSILLNHTNNNTFSKEEQFFINCHQMPKPQVEIGRILARSGARIALNDISDGVASEAHEIAESSQVKMIIQANKIPYSHYMNQYSMEQRLNWLLYGGEDFQLIGTISKKDWHTVSRECEKEGLQITKIGNVAEGSGVFLETDGELIEIDKKGYNHFQKDR